MKKVIYQMKKGLKRLVDKVIQKLLGTRIDDCLAKQKMGLFLVEPWFKQNLWEPPVLYALRDFIRPGDIVFDVGANVGGLSAACSRAVGPKGLVVAFEASPRIVGISHS